jgi:translation elongation factor EF-Tu-like GTPase
METIRVRLYVLSVEQGGRRGPIASGYRAGCWIDPIDPAVGGNDGILTVEGADRIVPGSERIALIRFLHPELVQHKLDPGLVFELREGARVVARAAMI